MVKRRGRNGLIEFLQLSGVDISHTKCIQPPPIILFDILLRETLGIMIIYIAIFPLYLLSQVVGIVA